MVNLGRSEAGFEYDLFPGMSYLFKRCTEQFLSVQKEDPCTWNSKVLGAVGLAQGCFIIYYFSQGWLVLSLRSSKINQC